MKKVIFLLVTLMIACSGEASAQKWLKNVGKALEKVDKFLDTSTTSSSSSKSSSKSPSKSSAAGTTKVNQADSVAKADPGPFGLSNGYWGKEADGVARSISFAPEGVKEEFGNEITYGTIVTMTLPNYNMDEDEITKLTINGNTADIEYICYRAYDENNNKGQARAIYDPVTKTMTLKIIKAPEGCWHESWGPLKFQKAEE